jgi:hypothetical protein
MRLPRPPCVVGAQAQPSEAEPEAPQRIANFSGVV